MPDERLQVVGVLLVARNAVRQHGRVDQDELAVVHLEQARAGRPVVHVVRDGRAGGDERGVVGQAAPERGVHLDGRALVHVVDEPCAGLCDARGDARADVVVVDVRDGHAPPAQRLYDLGELGLVALVEAQVADVQRL